MPAERTREPQYDHALTIRDTEGIDRLGLVVNQAWRDDPRHLVFSFARYKFVAKMLSGCSSALEIGCADAFLSRIVRQEVPAITAIDFDPHFIQDARQRMSDAWPIDCRVHDILESPVDGEFESAYALDVLEHISPDLEERFLLNILASLTPDGVLIVGSPSIQSQEYASAPSRAGHVNCKDGRQLKQVMSAHFENVFLFSMNDEVVHTGYYPMAHYLLALCCSPKRA